MSHLTRRRFLSDSAIAAAALAVTSDSNFISNRAEAVTDSTTTSLNDMFNVMVCGVHSRGGVLIEECTKANGCRIKYICDIDEVVGQRRIDNIEKRFGYRPQFIRDMRKAFDDKDLDLVVIATANHWHALGGIGAMQAGKDVYLEKPVSHNIFEGRRLIEAARKYKKICQTGTQSRSLQGDIDAIQFVKSGKIGDVKLARGLCYKRRGSIGKKGIYQPPKSVDYNLWVGPAEMQPLTRPNFHYDWHWQYSFGNGDINNQGVHQMDIARWGLGVDSLSDSVISYGGRLGYVDAGDAANTQIAIHKFGGKTIVFEVRGLKTDPLLKANIGNIFYGTDGVVVLTDWDRGYAMDLDGNVVKKFSSDANTTIGGRNHFRNFLDAVKSRNPGDLNAEVREGHLSAGLGHTATISYRLGKQVPIELVKNTIEAFGGADDNVETLERTIAHLKDNGVDLNKTPITLGPMLKMDTKTETFINNDTANTMLTRKYRKGFEVPKSGKV